MVKRAPYCTKDDLEFYQYTCIFLSILCLFLLAITILTYYLLSKKINKLVSIHEMGMT